MNWHIDKGDAVQWAINYRGPFFHALLCDPPYHLTSGNSKTGFMGKTWDGGEVAFRPDTWAAFMQVLYPGAFGMAFASSRGWHRLAVAIEDAGFVIHPTIFGWLNGQGFPKAARIDLQIDKSAGRIDERITGTRHGTGYTKGNVKQGAQNRFSTEFSEYGEPVTDLAKAWKGHRYGLQALKPSVEPIIVFQKPYNGRPVDSILQTGAGAINVDAGRIGSDKKKGVRSTSGFTAKNGIYHGSEKYEIENHDYDQDGGRWPANFIVGHTSDCKKVGTKTIPGYQINRFVDGAKPWGNGAGHEFESEEMGDQVIDVYECAPGCPVESLGDPVNFFFNTDWSLEESDPVLYFSKVSKTEREKGLRGSQKRFMATMGDGIGEREHSEDEQTAYVLNDHPTLKPISLTKYLAKLLLPPVEYAPRRLFVPFAGAGSEMIGGALAGFDDVQGLELDDEDRYIDIAEARLAYWTSYKTPEYKAKEALKPQKGQTSLF